MPVILVDEKQFSDNKKCSSLGFLHETGSKPSSNNNFFEASEVSDSDESENYYSLTPILIMKQNESNFPNTEDNSDHSSY